MEINTVMKETIYSILQEPTREKFVEYLLNGGGEQDNVDFKEKMIDHQKLSEVILGIANNGGGVIIFGIKENDDGTIEAVGLEQLKDKEKVTSKLQKYLPEALHINVIDYDFTNENYSKLNGKLFQMICIECNDLDLPYVWKKDTDGVEAGCIFYRRGTKTIKANMQEIKEMIDKRIEAAYIEESNLQLEEHLKQLKTLYNYISPNKFVSPFDKIWGNIYGTSGVTSIAGISNPNYPKESYEDFITKMIEKKKKKIEKVLDLK